MIRRNRGFLDLALGSLLMTIAVCRPWGGESAQQEQTPVHPVAQTSARERGRQVFLSNCNGCHPGGGAGVGPALKNRPIPESLVRSQVRNGRGIMPAFSPDRISDEQLEALVAYVTNLHRQSESQ
jgi:mono/diheme cytochrome c family protein